MNDFKDLGVESTPSNLIGDKIKVTKVLDKPIEVHNYIIGPSKKFEGEEYLSLQVKFNDEMHVIFSRSKGLMDLLRKIPKDKIPFTATIIKDDHERLIFT